MYLAPCWFSPLATASGVTGAFKVPVTVTVNPYGGTLNERRVTTYSAPVKPHFPSAVLAKGYPRRATGLHRVKRVEPARFSGRCHIKQNLHGAGSREGENNTPIIPKVGRVAIWRQGRVNAFNVNDITEAGGALDIVPLRGHVSNEFLMSIFEVLQI